MDRDQAGVLGRRVLRVEDERLLTVGGTYVDDVQVPELTRAARVTFVRSPCAHALITGIDASAALAEPGVVAVLTAEDAAALPGKRDDPMAEPLLAADRVRFVGEPVAMVITDGRYQGEDAAELVSVDYDLLDAVIDLDAALAGQTLLFPAAGTNLVAADGDLEDTGDALFDGCDAVAEATIVNQRVAPVPIEARGAAATWAGGRLTVWASTQNAQIARSTLAKRLGLDRAAVRVIVPDVGGGFGAKIGADRDMIAVAWAATRVGKPVRWAETRRENLVAMTHGRGQRQRIRIGGTRDGRILAYRLDLVQDAGAYPRGAAELAFLTRLMASGAYQIPRVECAYRVVVTSTTPIAAYRGAGRPEATSAIERAVDLLAAEIGLDPAEVRRVNMVPPGSFPYTSPTGAVYDTGDYAAALDKVLTAAGYAELRTDQARRRERGDPVQLGIGLSAYVEITAADASDGETGRVEEGLGADVLFVADGPTFPFGAHVAVVEVDTETGRARLVRHVTVDDAGTLVNPLLAEGQRHGGIAQGAAQALLEEVLYDAHGNPLTGTLADYAIITAAELPSFELVDSQTPATVNPLGAKGIGEAGTIGATPAVQNAVVDALAHLGIRHIDMPATPRRVWAAISESGAGR
jgi:aerobic carbon-monoxide dehydrogenase large subunit